MSCYKMEFFDVEIVWVLLFGWWEQLCVNMATVLPSRADSTETLELCHSQQGSFELQ